MNLLDVLNSNSFAVMVEDCHIAFPSDLIHAFERMIALHYVFNLSYDAPTQAYVVLIQKLILNLADNYERQLNLIAKTRKNNLD